MESLVHDWQLSLTRDESDPAFPSKHYGLAARLCVVVCDLYRLILAELSDQLPKDTYRRLEQSYDYLRLWADGYQVEAGQLDAVLLVSKSLRHATLRHLAGVSRTLTGRLFPRIKGRPSDAIQYRVSEAKDQADTATHIISDEGDSDADSDSESDRASVYTTASKIQSDIDDAIEDLRTDIQCLVDFGPRYEEPVLDCRDKEQPAPASQVELWDPAAHLVDRVRQRYPQGDARLVTQLGRANWQRILRLQAQKEATKQKEPAQQKECAGGEQAASINFQPTGVQIAAPATTSKSRTLQSSNFHDSGLGTSVPTMRAYAETVMSYHGASGSSIKIPPIPEEAAGGKPFTCPTCGCSIVITNKNLWKRHIIADLQPYICISPDCSFSAVPFPNKSAWVNHLNLDHELCKTTQDATCPLCNELAEEEKPSFISHLARHLEEVSLTILPANTDPDDESDHESDSASAVFSVEAISDTNTDVARLERPVNEFGWTPAMAEDSVIVVSLENVFGWQPTTEAEKHMKQSMVDWASKSMYDKFEGVLTKCGKTHTTGDLECLAEKPSMRCLDCPGKLYPVSSFDRHLNHRAHCHKVSRRVAAEVAEASERYDPTHDPKLGSGETEGGPEDDIRLASPMLTSPEPSIKGSSPSPTEAPQSSISFSELFLDNMYEGGRKEINALCRAFNVTIEGKKSAFGMLTARGNEADVDSLSRYILTIKKLVQDGSLAADRVLPHRSHFEYVWNNSGPAKPLPASYILYPSAPPPAPASPDYGNAGLDVMLGADNELFRCPTGCGSALPYSDPLRFVNHLGEYHLLMEETELEGPCPWCARSKALNSTPYPSPWKSLGLLLAHIRRLHVTDDAVDLSESKTSAEASRTAADQSGAKSSAFASSAIAKTPPRDAISRETARAGPDAAAQLDPRPAQTSAAVLSPLQAMLNKTPLAPWNDPNFQPEEYRPEGGDRDRRKRDRGASSAVGRGVGGGVDPTFDIVEDPILDLEVRALIDIGKTPMNPTSPSPDPEPTNTLACSYCNEVIKKNRLRRHILKTHPHKRGRTRSFKFGEAVSDDAVDDSSDDSVSSKSEQGKLATDPNSGLIAHPPEQNEPLPVPREAPQLPKDSPQRPADGAHPQVDRTFSTEERGGRGTVTQHSHIPAPPASGQAFESPTEAPQISWLLKKGNEDDRPHSPEIPPAESAKEAVVPDSAEKSHHRSLPYPLNQLPPDALDISSDERVPPIQPADQTGRTRISIKAISVLETWRNDHASNPYPTEAELQQLVEATGITTMQVEGWLSGRRARATGANPPNRSRLPGADNHPSAPSTGGSKALLTHGASSPVLPFEWDTPDQVAEGVDISHAENRTEMTSQDGRVAVTESQVNDIPTFASAAVSRAIAAGRFPVFVDKLRDYASLKHLTRGCESFEPAVAFERWPSIDSPSHSGPCCLFIFDNAEDARKAAATEYVPFVGTVRCRLLTSNSALPPPPPPPRPAANLAHFGGSKDPELQLQEKTFELKRSDHLPNQIGRKDQNPPSIYFHHWQPPPGYPPAGPQPVTKTTQSVTEQNEPGPSFQGLEPTSGSWYHEGNKSASLKRQESATSMVESPAEILAESLRHKTGKHPERPTYVRRNLPLSVMPPLLPDHLMMGFTTQEIEGERKVLKMSRANNVEREIERGLLGVDELVERTAAQLKEMQGMIRQRQTLSTPPTQWAVFWETCQINLQGVRPVILQMEDQLRRLGDDLSGKLAPLAGEKSEQKRVRELRDGIYQREDRMEWLGRMVGEIEAEALARQTVA